MTPVRVAVVDSGWNRARTDARVLAGVAFTGDAASPGTDDDDRVGHGTACIGEVLRWAPAAAVLPVRVFGAEMECAPEAIARAIRWAAAAGARVISLSLGTRRTSARPILASACRDARAAGALLVAAGPNAGPPTLPAALPGVIAVWPGPGLHPGELRRRGPLQVEAWTGPRSILGGGDTPGSGTSLAAAEVAGRIAHLLAEGAPADARRLLARLTDATG